MEEKNWKNNQIIVFIVGLLIGFGLGFFIFSDKSPSDSFFDKPAETDQLADSEPISPPEDESLSSVVVADQLAGNIVILNHAVLLTPSWIVIYDDFNGEPKNILGARYFDSGEYDNLNIESPVDTTSGNKYHVLIHQDDGKIEESEFGRHPFDYTKDLAITDSAGQKISQSFNTLLIGARGL